MGSYSAYYGSAIAWYPRYINSICLVFTYRKNAFNGFLPYSLCCLYLLPQSSFPYVVFYQATFIARMLCSLFPHSRRVAADSSSASLLKRIASRYPSTISLVAYLAHLWVFQHRLEGQIGCFLAK